MAWEEKLEDSLVKIGIEKGQTVLDFGCGEGNYSLPAAKITGEEGKVYGLDRNKEKLRSLEKKGKDKDLGWIEPMEKDFSSEIPLPDKSIDVALLYDIFWYFSLESEKLPKLLDEMYRISKDNALVSVYPEHTDREKLREKIEEYGFRFDEKNYLTVIHENKTKDDWIYNFRKIGATDESRRIEPGD